MKKKDALIYILGASCLISGISIFSYYTYCDAKITNAIQENLANSIVYVTDKNLDGTDAISINRNSDLVDINLDADFGNVDADQEITKVQTYTNVISIPQIDVLAYINEGVEHDALAGGVGHHEGTYKVGEKGNCVIAGHASNIYNCIFNNLDNVKLYETFYAYDSIGVKHTYYITSKYLCDPSNTTILTPVSSDRSKVILYSCASGGDMRLVVEGEEFTEDEFALFKAGLRSQFTQSILSMNDNYELENLTAELDSRVASNNRHYNVEYIYQGVGSSIVENLSGVVNR